MLTPGDGVGRAAHGDRVVLVHRGRRSGGDFFTVQLCPVGGTVICDHHMVSLFDNGGVQAGEFAVAGDGDHGLGACAPDGQLAVLHLALQHGAVGAVQGDGRAAATGRRSGSAAGIDLHGGLLLFLLLVGLRD